MDIEDYSLDYYLDNINEQNKNIQEIDAEIAGITLAGVSIYVISSICGFLISASVFNKSVKIDTNLSKKLNNILKSGNYWIVHKWPDVVPNAFAIKGNHIFITTELIKILNEREQLGVLLHESFHCADLHSWKSIASESSFLYLIVFVALTISAATVPVLGILVAFILHNSFKIAYARIIGRKHEIKADEFAAKNGYGPDLISALNKLEKWGKSKSSNAPCGKICQLERKVSTAIDEHPSTKKRIEIILKKTNELNTILKSASFKKISSFVTGVFKNNG